MKKAKTPATNEDLISDFIKSLTFLIWQKYCNLRDKSPIFLSKNWFSRNIKQDDILKAKTFRLWKRLYVINDHIKTHIFKPVINVLKKYLPKKVKKYFKSVSYKCFLLIKPIKIDKDINKEWDNWRSVREKHSTDVIIFGIISYDYRHQRPQHLAEELAKIGHRVFYIEQEFLLYQKKANSQAPFQVKKVKRNIYKVKLSSKNNLFIYKDIISKKDKDLILASFKTFIQKTSIVNPVAKIDHPFWVQIASELDMPIIYDCMDDHSSFKESSSEIYILEAKLFKKSDLVLVSSNALEIKAKKLKTKNIIIIKNAGDYTHFFKATENNLPIPREISSLQRPIAGYYGAISQWFDTDVLKTLSNNFKKASIVLIGRVDNRKVETLANKHDNIYLLGEKPYNQLPAYLQEFDVCLIPFVINDLIKATNPVKIYEYLAAGKPVVTTNIPELREYKDSIYISKDSKDFSNNVRKALREKDKRLIKKRQKISKENTWNKRGKSLNRAINKVLFPKVSVIILSYNNADITEKCLNSVLNRSFYPNLEVVIVDNASNTAVLKVLDKFEKDGRVKVIKNRKNLGFAKGNNIGAKKASGDYLIFLNNDTIVTPGWISRLLFHIKKKGVGLVGPVTNNIGNEAKINISYNPNNQEGLERKSVQYTHSHWGETLEFNNIAAFCWILSKNTYEKIGEFDTRFGKGLFEDDDYCMRVRKAGLKILVAEDVFVHHWGGSSTKWQSKKYQKLFDENKKEFEKKWNVKWQPHKYRKGVT